MSYPWVDGPAELSVGGYGAQAPAVAARIKAASNLAHEITDEQIERDKAGNRGLFMAEFRKILDDCDNGDQDDPRWHELRLRTLDRMAKLTRVYEPDAPSVRQGPGDPRILAGQAAAFLTEMEASLAETRTPKAGEVTRT